MQQQGSKNLAHSPPHPMTLGGLGQSKLGCKDQISIQSSTTPDPGYQWESDKLTVDTTNESQEVSSFQAGVKIQLF